MVSLKFRKTKRNQELFLPLLDAVGSTSMHILFMDYKPINLILFEFNFFLRCSSNLILMIRKECEIEYILVIQLLLLKMVVFRCCKKTVAH